MPLKQCQCLQLTSVAVVCYKYEELRRIYFIDLILVFSTVWLMMLRIVQELGAIYLPEMTKRLTGIFVKDLPRTFKTGLLKVGQWWVRILLTPF